MRAAAAETALADITRASLERKALMEAKRVDHEAEARRAAAAAAAKAAEEAAAKKAKDKSRKPLSTLKSASGRVAARLSELREDDGGVPRTRAERRARLCCAPPPCAPPPCALPRHV